MQRTACRPLLHCLHVLRAGRRRCSADPSGVRRRQSPRNAAIAMKKATYGWFTFIAALFCFGAAYLLPQARSPFFYAGIVLIIVTAGLRPGGGGNKWGT